eukprot:5132161-Pyramimonas_sp.AAC.1
MAIKPLLSHSTTGEFNSPVVERLNKVLMAVWSPNTLRRRHLLNDYQSVGGQSDNVYMAILFTSKAAPL